MDAGTKTGFLAVIKIPATIGKITTTINKISPFSTFAVNHAWHSLLFPHRQQFFYPAKLFPKNIKIIHPFVKRNSIDLSTHQGGVWSSLIHFRSTIPLLTHFTSNFPSFSHFPTLHGNTFLRNVPLLHYSFIFISLHVWLLPYDRPQLDTTQIHCRLLYKKRKIGKAVIPLTSLFSPSLDDRASLQFRFQQLCRKKGKKGNVFFLNWLYWIQHGEIDKKEKIFSPSRDHLRRDYAIKKHILCRAGIKLYKCGGFDIKMLAQR